MSISTNKLNFRSRVDRGTRRGFEPQPTLRARVAVTQMHHLSLTQAKEQLTFGISCCLFGRAALQSTFSGLPIIFQKNSDQTPKAANTTSKM